MKKLFASLAVLLSLAATEHAFALTPSNGGVDGGGGGKSVVCRNSKKEITKAWVLDLYEADFWGLKIVESNDPVDAQIERALARLKNSGYYDDYKSLVAKIKKNMRFLPLQKKLEKTKNAFPPIEPECPREQAVIFYNPKDIVFNRSIWNHLPPTHQAALLLHEAIYYVDREHGLTDSRRTRKIVAHLFSDKNIFTKSPKAGLLESARYCKTTYDNVTRTQSQFYLYQSGQRSILQFIELEGEVKLLPTVAFGPALPLRTWESFRTKTEDDFEGDDTLDISVETIVNSGTVSRRYYLSGKSGWLPGKIFPKREFHCDGGDDSFGGVQIAGVIGASNVKINLPHPVLIYGGGAGVTATNARSTNHAPFDTCKYAGTGSFSKLLACNNQAIDGNVVVTIQYVADKAGYPVLLTPSTTSTAGNVVVPYSAPTAPVPAGTYGSISFLWSSICAKMNNGSGGVDNNCQSTTPDMAAMMTFTLGISSLSSTSPTADVSTGVSVEFRVNSNLGSLDANGGSTTTTCEDPGAGGICAFSVSKGVGGKVALRGLYPGVNFPTGGPLPAMGVRLLWAEGENSFDKITAGNATGYRDLELDLTADAPAVKNARIDGFALNKSYSFKIAIIDAAGNVGFYTDPSADHYCSHSSGSPDCHIARPTE